MAPLLSVIVPIYNTKNYLRECIDSILAQTFIDYELILVDDGSTDGSSEICDEYADNNENVKVIHKENCGLLHTRKVGLSAACGDYISYIDSDDYIASDMYEYMMEKITSNNADIAICNILWDKDGIITPMFTHDKHGFYNKQRLKEEIYPYMLFSNDPKKTGLIPSLCNKIIRKSILEKVLNDADNSISYGEDALCSYPCLLDANSVYIAEDQFFYYYRQISTSLTNAYDKKLLYKFNLLIELLDKNFSARGFEGKKQIDCYAAKGSLECLRKELLFNKDEGVVGRIRIAREFATKPRFREAFSYASKEKFPTTTKAKILLIKNRCFFLLYLLFYLKYRYLLLKGRK